MGFAVPCVALWDCSLAQFVVFFCDENQGQLVLAWLQCCEHHFKTWRRLGLCSMCSQQKFTAVQPIDAHLVWKHTGSRIKNEDKSEMQ